MTCETDTRPATIATPVPELHEPAPPGRRPVQRSPRWTLGALAAAAFATVTVELIPTGLLPAIAADLRVSPSAAGSLVAVWALTLATTSLLLVRATRRLPRQRVIAVAVLVCGLSTLASAVAPTLAVAVAARLVGAAAHGLVWALLVSHAASVVPPERLGRAVSIVLAGPTAATVLGVPLGTALGGLLGWRVTFAVLAVLTVPPAWVLFTGRAQERPAGAGTGGAWWRDRSMAPVLAIAAATSAILAGHFVAATYVAVLVTDAGGLPGTAVPWVLLVFGAAGAAGLAVAGPLSDRRPTAALPLTAVGFAAGLAALGLLGVHPVLAVVVVAVWGFLVGLLFPVFQTRVARLATPAVRDMAGAVAVTALNLGIAGGAALGGVVLARSGPTGVVVAAAAAAAAGAALLLLRPHRAAGDRSAS